VNPNPPRMGPTSTLNPPSKKNTVNPFQSHPEFHHNYVILTHRGLTIHQPYFVIIQPSLFLSLSLSLSPSPSPRVQSQTEGEPTVQPPRKQCVSQRALYSSVATEPVWLLHFILSWSTIKWTQLHRRWTPSRPCIHLKPTPQKPPLNPWPGHP